MLPETDDEAVRILTAVTVAVGEPVARSELLFLAASGASRTVNLDAVQSA